MKLTIDDLYDLKEQGVAVVGLFNYADIAVGALYLQTVDFSQILLTTTKMDDKFYLYIGGLGIYFSEFKILKFN